MQDRLVVLVTAALVAAIAVTAVVIPMIHSDPNYAVLPYDLTIRNQGSLDVGANITFLVDVRAHTGLPYPVAVAFLSLELGSNFEIQSSDAGANPWHLLNVWNVSGVDFAATHTYSLTATLADTTNVRVEAILWTPRGDLSAVQIDATGDVNPASVSILGLATF